MAQTSLLKNSIGWKIFTALTGLFLVIFLLGHLSGNLQLLLPDPQLQFNEYAKFMTTNPAVKVLSYLTYISIILHAILAIALSIQAKKARPVGYAYEKNSGSWSSRSMALLGCLILLYVVIHMWNFWYQMHFGDIGTDANGNRDIYTVVETAFNQWWYVVLYVLAMIPLGFHLSHGFQSGFQTLGVNHKTYSPIIKRIGLLIAIAIPAAFALIPIIMFLRG